MTSDRPRPENTWPKRHPVLTTVLAIAALLGGLYVWNNYSYDARHPETPYQRYSAAAVRAQLPGAWPESAVQTIATGACNPDQTSMKKVLVAAQAEKTPEDFATELTEVYFVSRYYCSDKDQHLLVFKMMTRDWPNSAIVVSALADKADGI
jgi:hypothetical protein